MDRLGPNLVAVTQQPVDADPRHTDRPEPPSAGWVVQVGTLVCRADEHALTWHLLDLRPVGSAESIGPFADEALDRVAVAAGHVIELFDFEDPAAREGQGGV